MRSGRSGFPRSQTLFGNGSPRNSVSRPVQGDAKNVLSISCFAGASRSDARFVWVPSELRDEVVNKSRWGRVAKPFGPRSQQNAVSTAGGRGPRTLGRRGPRVFRVDEVSVQALGGEHRARPGRS